MDPIAAARFPVVCEAEATYRDLGGASNLSEPHVHPALEIGYIHSGRGTFRVGTKHMPFRAGDICIINSTEPHLAYFPVTSVCSWVYMDPPRLLAHATDDATVLDTSPLGGVGFLNIFVGSEYPWLEGLVRQLVEEMRDQRPFFAQVVRGLSLSLLSRLHRLRLGGDTHFVRAHRARAPLGLLTRVQPAIAYIHEHYADPIDVAALAKTVSMSPTHFTRVFRNAVGCSPHRYVIHHRVLSAMTLLLEGKLGTEQIGERCGFGDASGLRKAFKKHQGVSPRRWLTT